MVEAATQLAAFYTNDFTQGLIADISPASTTPANKAVARSARYLAPPPRNMRVIVDMLDNKEGTDSRGWPYFEYFQQWQLPIRDLLPRVYNGEVAVKDGLQQAAEQGDKDAAAARAERPSAPDQGTSSTSSTSSTSLTLSGAGGRIESGGGLQPAGHQVAPRPLRQGVAIHQAPERGRVVGLLEVRQLVHQDVVPHPLRKSGQAVGEAQAPGAHAAAPEAPVLVGGVLHRRRDEAPLEVAPAQLQRPLQEGALAAGQAGPDRPPLEAPAEGLHQALLLRRLQPRGEADLQPVAHQAGPRRAPAAGGADDVHGEGHQR